MTTQPLRIQKLRIQRAWSQQQLADMSGLSVRTIQRIESGESASLESLKSLAAVFELNIDDLKEDTPMMQRTDFMALGVSEREEAAAFEYVRGLRRLYQHLIRYGIVVIILLGLRFTVLPEKQWILWVIGGLGLGILLHAFRFFGMRGWFGGEWERRQVEKRLGRRL